jgi:hypothetical protein
MGHFQPVKNENGLGDAGRLYQAVRQYAERLLKTASWTTKVDC